MSVCRHEDLVRRALATFATRGVPEDVDLWPAIECRLHQTQRRAGTDCGGRLSWARRQSIFTRMSVVAVLVGLLLLSGFPWAGEQEPSASAAGLLNSLAEVAARQERSATVSGYRYIKSDTAYLSTSIDPKGESFTAIVPKQREMWVGPDGSGAIRETASEPIFLGERDRARWQAAGSPNLKHAINERFGPGGLTYEDFTRLPTNTDALADAIQRQAAQAGPPIDVEMFIVVGDILRQPGVPRELRAALYKVAAQIPGVELIGETTDSAGRSGVGVAKTTDYWGGKQRFVLIFDPATSALLAEETVLLEPVDWLDATPPVVIGRATYLDTGMVSSLPDEVLSIIPQAAGGQKQVVPASSQER